MLTIVVDQRIERETTDLRQHLQNVAREVAASWDDETLNTAIEARSRALAACFRAPFGGGAAAIAALRERGLGIGLISNCSSDVRGALHDHGLAGWFDAIVLSAEIGVMKPAAEIYLAAAERLGVESRHCLYVGDGSDDELEGAAAAGMTPFRYDPTGTRHATTITSHLQLIDLVEATSLT